MGYGAHGDALPEQSTTKEEREQWRRERVAPRRSWPDPEPWMLEDQLFNAIWECVKKWDINVPDAYVGYCGATGNHARAIFDAIGCGRLHKPVPANPTIEQAEAALALEVVGPKITLSDAAAIYNAMVLAAK